MDVEVCVHTEMTATLGLVQAAAFKMGIWDEPSDPRHLLKEPEEGLAIQLREQIPPPARMKLGAAGIDT